MYEKLCVRFVAIYPSPRLSGTLANCLSILCTEGPVRELNVHLILKQINYILLLNKKHIFIVRF